MVLLDALWPAQAGAESQLPLIVGGVVIAVALVGLAVALVRRRLAYLDRKETLFWARRGARDGVQELRKQLAGAKEIAADERLAPRLTARLAGYEARLADMERRFEALPDGLAEELRALKGECEQLGAAVGAVRWMRQRVGGPHHYVAQVAARAGQEQPHQAGGRAKRPAPVSAQQAEELRARLARLERRRADVEALLEAEPPPKELPQQSHELAEKYMALGNDAYRLWELLYPEEAKVAQAEASAMFDQLLDFQRRFREEQERDRAEQREIDRRERERRGDDESLLDKLL